MHRKVLSLSQRCSFDALTAQSDSATSFLHTEAVEMPTVHLLDYAAGNIRSLVNAIEKLGWDVEWIKSPGDVAKAEVSYLLISIQLQY